MFKLLNTWYEKTGEPALINTSFNRHEEPIINTPVQTLEALIAGTVDLVSIADKYVVECDDRLKYNKKEMIRKAN